MATAEEIALRVTESDKARSATRSARAQEVGELAAQQAAAEEVLRTIEDQLGATVAAAHEVMTIDELAEFTDVPAAKLSGWLTARKPNRGKRKRPAPGAAVDTNRGPSPAKTSTARPISTPPAPTGIDDAQAPVRVPAEVA